MIKHRYKNEQKRVLENSVSLVYELCREGAMYFEYFIKQEYLKNLEISDWLN